MLELELEVSSDRSGIGTPMPCMYGGETRRAFLRLRSVCFGSSFWALERAAAASASSLTDESLDDMPSTDSSSSWFKLCSISASSHSSFKESGSSTSNSKSATARQLGQRNWGQLF